MARNRVTIEMIENKNEKPKSVELEFTPADLKIIIKKYFENYPYGVSIRTYKLC